MFAFSNKAFCIIIVLSTYNVKKIFQRVFRMALAVGVE